MSKRKMICKVILLVPSVNSLYINIVNLRESVSKDHRMSELEAILRIIQSSVSPEGHYCHFEGNDS